MSHDNINIRIHHSVSRCQVEFISVHNWNANGLSHATCGKEGEEL